MDDLLPDVPISTDSEETWWAQKDCMSSLELDSPTKSGSTDGKDLDTQTDTVDGETNDRKTHSSDDEKSKFADSYNENGNSDGRDGAESGDSAGMAIVVVTT